MPRGPQPAKGAGTTVGQKVAVACRWGNGSGRMTKGAFANQRIAKGKAHMAEQQANIHPGEVLLEEFLRPLRISQNGLARAIDVPPRRINEIVQGKRAMTADTALRLARYFGTSAGF